MECNLPNTDSMNCTRKWPIADVKNKHHRSSARHKQSYMRTYRASYFCTADSFPSTSDPSLSGALFSGHHKCPVYMKLFLSSITSFVVLRTRDAGAIKNHTQCVEENDCLSFWRKSLPASSGVRNYQKSSALPDRRIAIVIRARIRRWHLTRNKLSVYTPRALAMGFPGFKHEFSSFDYQKSPHMRTSVSGIALPQCQSRTARFPHMQGVRKEEAARKINSSDYICCELFVLIKAVRPWQRQSP